jgi:hypothetical protein
VNQVRDHDVAVQLRVVGPARLVGERRGDVPIGADPRGALPVTLMPAEAVRRLLLEVGDRGCRGRFVRRPDRRRDPGLGESEQRGDALRR